MPGSYLVLEPDLTIAAVSDAYLRAMMMTREEIIGRPFFDVFPEHRDEAAVTDAHALRASFARALDGRAPDTITARRYGGRRGEGKRDKSEEYWSCINTPVAGPCGEVAYVIHRVEDVTELVRLAATERGQQERIEEAERFREIVENINEVLWMVDPGMRTMLYISPAYERVWGRTRASLYASARSWLDALHQEDRQRVLEAVLTSMSRGDTFDHAYRIVRPDGTVRWIHDRGFPIRHEGGEVERYVGIAKDVTDLKKAEDDLRRSEEQLDQARRMDAVGRLAGGVAHDFNNLMTAVAGYTSLILQRLDKSDPLRKEIEEIRKAGDRATALTRQLLAFGRKQVLQPKVLNLNPIVADMGNMLRRLIGEDIALVFLPGHDLGNMNADPSQLEQVVVNLVLNARDAMAGGGRLTLETKNAVLDAAYARTHVDVMPGRYVMLVVSDTGVGMSAETLSHLFEPFFTTKANGVGAGFGLSTVYGIVKQSGGHIDVSSQLGRGTTFTVYFPRLDDGPLQATRRSQNAQLAVRGTETILLVEDDDLVRDVTRTMLVAYGYSVLTASTADEAVLLAAQHGGRVDLVLTDIVMPQMDGRHLAERITRTRPGVGVIYMSGYTEDAIARHGQIDPGTAFIQKPFAAEEIASKIRKVLDAAS